MLIIFGLSTTGKKVPVRFECWHRFIQFHIVRYPWKFQTETLILTLIFWLDILKVKGIVDERLLLVNVFSSHMKSKFQSFESTFNYSGEIDIPLYSNLLPNDGHYSNPTILILHPLCNKQSGRQKQIWSLGTCVIKIESDHDYTSILKAAKRKDIPKKYLKQTKKKIVPDPSQKVSLSK